MVLTYLHILPITRVKILHCFKTCWTVIFYEFDPAFASDWYNYNCCPYHFFYGPKLKIVVKDTNGKVFLKKYCKNIKTLFLCRMHVGLMAPVINHNLFVLKKMLSTYVHMIICTFVAVQLINVGIFTLVLSRWTWTCRGNY